VSSSSLIDAGESALLDGDWAAARAAFEKALEEGQRWPAALDGLGQAVWWQGEVRRAIELREEAYAGFVREGDLRRAAVIAVWLAREYFTVHSNMAACNGWLERAQSLLRETGRCPEGGWLELVRGFTSPLPDAMKSHAEEAMALGREHHEADLEIVGLSLFGLALVYGETIPDGMSRLDEAMAAATGGEVRSFFAVADVYCNTLLACERAGDLERVEQWCRVVTDFARRRNAEPIFPFCHVTYGGLLVATGRWAEAEQELELAVRTFDAGHRGMKVLALGRLAELRIRQGRIEDAVQLLSGYEGHPLALRPMARLHTLTGQPELAVAAVERRLQQTGYDSLLAVPMLALLVEARLALGDVAQAETAANALVALAERSGERTLIAEGRFALGRTRAAGGKDGALDLETALELYSRLELPFEAARARLELARALTQSRPEVARGEARLALGTFERLGAARHRDAAAELLRALGAGTTAGPRAEGELTRREQEVLELLAAGLPNAQIAARLFLSIKTVEHHVSRILSKLGLRSRSEAAAYLLRHGSGT
jgi:DNA-binding CsgD family transcriptional regulator